MKKLKNKFHLSSFIFQFKKGFTLLEILVVISIIGILAALSLPNFMSARARARDAQRKSDLREIQKALELYKLDQSPPAFISEAVGNTFPNTGAGWTGGANVYMNKVPGDPAAPYYYLPNNTTLTYSLAACLENPADPDGQACPAGFSCTSANCYVVVQP